MFLKHEKTRQTNTVMRPLSSFRNNIQNHIIDLIIQIENKIGDALFNKNIRESFINAIQHFQKSKDKNTRRINGHTPLSLQPFT